MRNSRVYILLFYLRSLIYFHLGAEENEVLVGRSNGRKLSLLFNVEAKQFLKSQGFVLAAMLR